MQAANGRLVRGRAGKNRPDARRRVLESSVRMGFAVRAGAEMCI
jgi:hypothetical protein